MKTLCLCEALTGQFPSSFSHMKLWKPPSFEFTSSSASKWRSGCNSFKFSVQSIKHMKEEIPSSGHIHGEKRDMKFRCIKKSEFLNLEENKVGYLIDEIQQIIERHHMVSFPKFHAGSKMALLIGILTFQAYQQAIAAPEFSHGLPSLSFFEDLGDINTGFASAFLLIFFSELGDKTFFIAALLAARNSGGVVFAGTFGALAAMTIVSVILGRTFHYVDGILPFRLGGTDFPIDDFAAVCLLVYFGVTTLLDTASGDELKIKEEQQEAELAISEFRGNGAGLTAAASTVISTFFLVFFAEWGDKSFFSTIALAAAASPLGVIGGALAGHAFATLLAVLGGSLLGTYISEKHMPASRTQAQA
ncbi:GDT1-like protein 1, chloroplastic [Phalaenopsis equestris]|uniref:GDT1-like protein 1, chloroplastic n=1 Tax=Phalaenopsis equestris TaxID=78828 RepID=UPI0009E50840|nr:GDT1-like protein 1, chloroplastic [Phalaenopsis equestris]